MANHYHITVAKIIKYLLYFNHVLQNSYIYSTHNILARTLVSKMNIHINAHINIYKEENDVIITATSSITISLVRYASITFCIDIDDLNLTNPVI